MTSRAVLRARGTGWLLVASVVAVILGVATMHEGWKVLSGEPAARAAAGAYVPFVLWFNFLAGFAYIAAGSALWARKRWAAALAAAIAAATLIVFAAFGIHVARGGAYEVRTVIAMTLRTLVWIAIAAAGWRWIWTDGERT